MKYDTLGNTDIQVSKICLGTMTWGEQNTEAEGHEQLDFAIEQGINFIDTAELYSVPARAETQGSTERIIGTWIHARKNRDKYILATKIAGPSAYTAHIRKNSNFAKHTTEALEGSLARLQTDFVDLYQLHWPERSTNFFGKLGYVHDHKKEWEDNFVEVLKGLDKHIKSGKIRHWGLSNETPWGTMRCLHLADQLGVPRPVSVQNPYSLLNRTYEIGMAEISIREKCGLLAYSPMAFGLLSGKYHKDENANGRIKLYKNFARYNSPQSYQATSKYLDLAEKTGISLAQLSLAFVNSRDFVTSNIIGATNLKQLKENIDSIQVELAGNVQEEINKIHAEIPNPAP